jgi:hypothetical protein
MCQEYSVTPQKLLRVEVPDALRGVGLEQRLAGSELTGSDPEGWAVVGTTDGNLADVLGTIRQWLRDEAIEHTVVHVGGRPRTLMRD